MVMKSIGWTEALMFEVEATLFSILKFHILRKNAFFILHHMFLNNVMIIYDFINKRDES